MDIEITALTKTYRGGVHALSGIDLQIPTGMFGLLGTNGAGKTTLMRILAGVLPATSGRVLWMNMHMPIGTAICDARVMKSGLRVSPVPCRPPV